MQQQPVTDIVPRIDLTSPIEGNELKFTLSGVNVSIANSLRRVILSDIPIVVFRVSPIEQNKCTVIANTCGLTNEIVKQRLSCIPIHIRDIEEFPLKNYVMELNVQNNTEKMIIVTTKDFTIKDKVSGKPIQEEKLQEIFPPNHQTGDFIDFVRLKPRPSQDIPAKSIHLTCDFDVGYAREDGAFNVVSTCSYGNTVNSALQEAELAKLMQKWKDEGKSPDEVKFEAENWKLLEGKRIFKEDSFDFVIETIGIYTNAELVNMSCSIMLKKLERLNKMINDDKLEIKLSENLMSNCYDIILEDEDYTLGKVIEYFIYKNYYKRGEVTFCGFKMLHPHDHYGIVRVAFKDPADKSNVVGILQTCIEQGADVYKKIGKEIMKLVKR